MRGRIRKIILSALLIAFAALGGGMLVMAPWRERGADLSFDTSVSAPVLATHPRVLFDHGHNNTHSLNGRFAPYRNLQRADGARITSHAGVLSREALQDCDILVIVNACGPEPHRDSSAFTESEIAAIRDWVSNGGSLLLAADHHPYGAAAATLARAFDIDMKGGWCEDSEHLLTGTADTGAILYRAENAMLGDHPIVKGRDASEAVKSVATFTGQSMGGPDSAVPLLICSPAATNLLPVSSKTETSGGTTTTTFETRNESAAGHSQALAMSFGQGRIVVTGEAAMLSAQIDDHSGLKFGMNVPGTDNRQFVLNACRWLAGELD